MPPVPSAQSDLVALATQFSVPPPIVYALSVIGTASPESVRLLSDQFKQTRSWEGAMAGALGTGQDVSQHSPQAGLVTAALGIAASRPTWGMQGWRPIDMDAFAAGAKAMERSAKTLARLGGVVTPDHVSAWGMAISQVRQPTGQQQGVQWPTPRPPVQPPPDVPQAKAIGEFGQKLKQLGVTPEHFKQTFPTVAKLQRRLLGATHVSVEDFAPHAGQTPDMVLKSVRDIPHQQYPEHTTGAMHDMYQTAQQFSIHHVGRSPLTLETARFIAAGMTHKDIEHYYAVKGGETQPMINIEPTRSAARPKVMEGGKHK